MKRMIGWMERIALEAGQTTAEYALVLLAAAAIAVVLIKWASGSDNGLNDFFSWVIKKIQSGVPG